MSGGRQHTMVSQYDYSHCHNKLKVKAANSYYNYHPSSSEWSECGKNQPSNSMFQSSLGSCKQQPVASVLKILILKLPLMFMMTMLISSIPVGPPQLFSDSGVNAPLDSTAAAGDYCQNFCFSNGATCWYGGVIRCPAKVPLSFKVEARLLSLEFYPLLFPFLSGSTDRSGASYTCRCLVLHYHMSWTYHQSQHCGGAVAGWST